MFKRIFTSAMILGAAAMAPPALAQSQLSCADRDEMTETLSRKYSESLTGAGLQSSKRLVELWSSAETGTFSIIITRPNGMSCLVASGEYWQLTPPSAADAADDAEPASG
ncbi:hypothetical protein OEZ60_08525 [Defluviimonas sp. WL0024]|uniref:Lipoprotein n=2 Tax=Albidovulum TaxID=205889 RepID=A0ABT3J1K6_9RHOB|nr:MULTISPECIES: hypothetical protein [Defluviimonas]MCU9848049.1 hypothetical protein [Defluviimonas sp. WL0024]MCW3781521.1 hypothetical protein [Defluviimonas salinarum]